MCLSCEDIARQSCAMVPKWRFLATFLRPVFSASRLHQVSDLHLKFALRPHHVWKYGQGWARDVSVRDRDETETFGLTNRDETETRRLQVSRRDRDVEVYVYCH